MAGPTFGFWYGDFTDSMVANLASFLASIASRFHQLPQSKRRLFNVELWAQTPEIDSTATIGVHLDRWKSDYYPGFVAEALAAELGSIPLLELTGFCMGNQPNDWNALRLIAKHIASTFGGWVIEHRSDTKLPNLPIGKTIRDSCVRQVIAKDEAGYFGDKITDHAYVRQYQQFVPVERYWVIDADAGPWVRK